jgi:hypothetical protein
VPEAPVPEPLVCPKCGKKRNADDQSCARCGLTFALWNAEAGVPLANLDPKGEELWAKVEANWSDSALHEDFLKHCLQAGMLAPAGRLYRQRLDDHPNDAIAAHMQGQVLAKATLGLSINKTVPREPVTRNRWFWVIVLTAMALGIAAGLTWRYVR